MTMHRCRPKPNQPCWHTLISTRWFTLTLAVKRGR
jgi:hypothetical protein